MATQLIHLPFEPGLSDSADPVVAGGKLYQAENVRFHKMGRVAKRYGLEPVEFETNLPTPTGGLTINAPTVMTGIPNAIGNYRGSPFLASDGTLALIAKDTAQGVTGTSRATTIVPGKISRVLPRRIDTVSFDPRTSTIAKQPDACKHGDNVLYVWGTAEFMSYAVHSPDGVVLKQKQLGQYGANARALEFDSFSTIVFLGQTSVDPNPYQLCVINVSHISHEFVAQGSELFSPFRKELVTLASGGSPAMDAVAYGGAGNFYVVYQSSATELSVAYYNGVDLINTATWAPGAGVVKVAISVVGSRVYIAYLRSSAISHTSFDLDLANQVSDAVLDNNYTFDVIPPGIYPYSSTVALVVYSGTDTTAGNNSYLSRTALVTVSDLSSSIGALTLSWHTKLASVPFLLGVRPCAWFSTAVDLGASGSAPAVTGWVSQRTYWLLELTNEYGAQSTAPALAMNAQPMVASATNDDDLLPKAVDMTDFWVCPLRNVYKRDPDNSNADMNVIQAVSWYDRASGSGNADNVLLARRDSAEAAGAVHFAGGAVSEYMGALVEAGFMHYPVIVEARRMTGAGALGQATASVWSYTSVFEWLDLQGRIHRSNPADPVSVTVGSSDRARLFVTKLAAGKSVIPTGINFPQVTAQVYRTVAGGSIYYKSAEFAAANNANVGTGPTSTIDDATTESSLISREILYTQGGVLGNLVPPAARYLANGGNRVWLAGLLEPRRILCSKLIVHEEPVQWPDDDSFRIEIPEDITGIKWGDGALIVFTENSIYLVSGDGPNDQGVGIFSTPQRLPSDVGCIEHHSIVETQDGWMFQSKRGIYLLPRGFGPPQFIGAEIQDTLLSFPTVRSAAVIADPGGVRHGETTVRYICADANGNTRVPVWDTALKRWVSVDKYEANDLALIGVHDDKAVVVRDSMGDPNPIRRELSTAWGDGSVGTGFVSSRIRTGNIRPFGWLGWGRVNRFEVMGEIRASTTLNARVSLDGATGTTLPAVKKLGDIGQRFNHQFDLPTRQCNSIDVELWDGASGASEGLVFHGITLEVDPLEGLPRRGAGERA